MSPSREERLRADFDAIGALKEASTIFEFDADGDPPDRYQVTFKGKGIRQTTGADESIEFVALHRCELRLPFSYPEQPPDIRWLTPIFHPNISFSGFIELAQVGLPWDPEVGLDVVCERLWDVARLAFVNLEDSTNYAAQAWFRDESQLQLPVDQRPLRDAAGSQQRSNVVKYRRRQADSDETKSVPGSHDGDVFFIGDEPPAPGRTTRAGRDENDDILYIE